MKNIYELPTLEKEKYRDEFGKLLFTKKINKWRIITFVLTALLIIISTILSNIMEDDGSNFVSVIQILNVGAIVSAGVFATATVYLNNCFKRWLKVKYEIQY